MEDKKNQTLGAILQQKREEFAVSIEDVARNIKIASALIRAMEEGNYRVFTARVYAKGIAKKLASYYRLSDGFDAEARAVEEWSEYYRAKDEENPEVRRLGIAGIFYITPARLLGTAALLFLVFFAGLFGWRLRLFMGTPALAVYEPVQNSVVEVPHVRVGGVAAKESRLTINGRDITIDETGGFNQEVELLAGVNELRFSVQNRFGKTTEETRYVVVK